MRQNIAQPTPPARPARGTAEPPRGSRTYTTLRGVRMKGLCGVVAGGVPTAFVESRMLPIHPALQRDTNMPPTNKVYAVSGGVHEGVYSTWAEALDAQYNKKAGFGNACSFDGEDRVANAEKWLKGRVPQPEHRADRWRNEVKEKPFVVRLFVMMVLITLFSITIAFLSHKVSAYFGCRTDYTRMADELCLVLSKVDMAVRESATYGARIVAAEVVIGIGLGFSWIFNILA